jgi:hypothetical protein
MVHQFLAAAGWAFAAASPLPWSGAAARAA